MNSTLSKQTSADHTVGAHLRSNAAMPRRSRRRASCPKYIPERHAHGFDRPSCGQPKKRFHQSCALPALVFVAREHASAQPRANSQYPPHAY